MADEAGTFGMRLRAFRLRANLSQEDLAERSGVSARTISNLEREHIRKPYQSTRNNLADALELRGATRSEFLSADRCPDGKVTARQQAGATSPYAAGSPSALPQHLPSPAPGFVGRGDELAQLSAVLGRAGNLPAVAMISGPPGVGKTELALRWAHEAREHQFPDGQLFVDLHGYGPEQPVSPADALALLLRSLGVADLSMPEGTSERGAAFRSLLAGGASLDR